MAKLNGVYTYNIPASITDGIEGLSMQAITEDPAVWQAVENKEDVNFLVVRQGIVNKILQDYPNVKWLQLLNAGFEKVDLELLKSRGITFTNARSVYCATIAEDVIAKILVLARRYLVHFKDQQNNFWPDDFQLPNGNLDLSGIVPPLFSAMQNIAEPLFYQNDCFPFRGNTAVFHSQFIAVPPYMAGNPRIGNTPVSPTDLPDRIFMLNAVDGVSLYQYGKLQQCEQDYLHAAVYGSLRGCHLWENRVNWKTLPNPMPRGVRPHGYQNPVQQEADEAFIARIDALRKDDWIKFDTFANTISLYSNSQQTRVLAQALLAKINAGTISDESAQYSFEEVLRSRSVTVLPLLRSALAYYNPLEWVEDSFLSLAEDMLMRRPAKIAALEKDAEELAELVRAVRKCSQKADETKQLLQMAPRLADLFSFGILTLPTPLLVAYTTESGNPQTVYNALKDNAAYKSRFHLPYAYEVCIAAKLVDMEDASHEEHGKMVQLKMLEDRLASDLEGNTPELSADRLAAFSANAQTLKSRLVANHTAILLASPMSLNMTLCDKQLCLNFLQDMMDTLDARALAFGMMLS